MPIHHRQWLYLLLLSTLMLPPASTAASLSPAVYQALQQAQRALKEGQPKRAGKYLKRAQSKARKTYDRALIEQNRAYVSMAAKDYPAAKQAITQALANQALPPGAAADLRYLQAQLLVRDRRTPQAITHLQALLHNNPKPPDGAQRLLAKLYLRNKQPQQAATLLEQLLKNSPKANDEVYDLLASADYRLHRYRHSIPLLKTLIRHHPANQGYWTRLIASQLAGDHPRQALATQELAHKQGYLSSTKDIQRLARLYRHRGLPLAAAKLLQQAIEQGQLPSTTAKLRELADAWQQAREWHKAGATLEQALTGCDESDRGPLHLQLGIAYYHAQDWQGAYRQLSLANGYAQTQPRAQQWLARLHNGHPDPGTAPSAGETSG
jgi:tetratricopeptide (TPR) repeat protein